MIKFLIQLLIEIILIIILFIKNFIDKKVSLILIIILLGVFLLENIFINKKKYQKSRKMKDAIFIIFGCSILLIGIMYLVGYITGFNVNYKYIFKNYLEKRVFIETIIIIILSEFLRREIVLFKTKNKYQKIIKNILLIILLVLIDCSISDISKDFKTFSQFYDYFGLIIVSSISKNIFLNYLVDKHGINTSLVYRLVMDIKIFFLPVTPKFNVFIESAIYLIYPYILYTVIYNIIEDKELENAKKKKHNVILDIPFYIFGIIIVMLVSREFTYSMIAIGSGSMTGEFSKGDAVIYKRYDKKNSTITSKKLVKGDIIVFNMKDRVVVHRINDIYKLYGEDVYITKGDANESIDNWVVTQKDIIGVVKKKIKFIAWPSVWLSENFK